MSALIAQNQHVNTYMQLCMYICMCIHKYYIPCRYQDPRNRIVDESQLIRVHACVYGIIVATNIWWLVIHHFTALFSRLNLVKFIVEAFTSPLAVELLLKCRSVVSVNKHFPVIWNLIITLRSSPWHCNWCVIIVFKSEMPTYHTVNHLSHDIKFRTKLNNAP